MDGNPYQPPQAYGPSAQGAAINRTPFVLAAVGAGFASAYWALITLLIAGAAVSGGTSGAQLFLPMILVGLYAVRAFQVGKGDPRAAQRLLWLHGVGCLFAVVQTISAGGLVAVLQGLKVVIHIFGGAAAFYALRAARNVGTGM